MSVREDDIRAAVRSRAQDITPDSVPPLRLSPGPLPRSPRPHWSRRWAAPLAAATAVAAVIAVVVAGTGGAGQRPMPAPAASGPDSGRPLSGRLTAGQIDRGVIGWFLTANGAQWTAGARLQGQVEALTVADTARCLGRAGVTVQPFDAARVAARYAAEAHNALDNVDLARIARTHSFGPVRPWYFRLRPAPGSQAAFRHWYPRCYQPATKRLSPFTETGTQLTIVPWALRIEQAEFAAPARAALPALRRCARRYGWPANPYGKPYTSLRSVGVFQEWVLAHVNGQGSQVTSVAYRRRVSPHWTRVYLTCGRPAVRAFERWLTTHQASFLRAHAAQVQKMERQARQELARAERLARQ